MSAAILSEPHPVATAQPNPPKSKPLRHALPHTGRRHEAATFGAHPAALDLLDFADGAR